MSDVTVDECKLNRVMSFDLGVKDSFTIIFTYTHRIETQSTTATVFCLGNKLNY